MPDNNPTSWPLAPNNRAIGDADSLVYTRNGWVSLGLSAASALPRFIVLCIDKHDILPSTGLATMLTLGLEAMLCLGLATVGMVYAIKGRSSWPGGLGIVVAFYSLICASWLAYGTVGFTLMFFRGLTG